MLQIIQSMMNIKENWLDSLQVFYGRKSKRSVIKNDVKSNPKSTDQLNENYVHLL